MSADKTLEFTPVVIVGAGRSGTNVLRDTLCRISSFGTWDCDEINPVWRHGNLAVPHDEFKPEHARPSVRRFIRRRFISQWKRLKKPDFLVEKTCANSLRTQFVAAVLPEAKFIYIVRDGRDVVVSAGKRWRGELEMPGLPYYWAKARNTPLADLPVYAWRFVRSRLDKLLTSRERLPFWGPQFAGLTDLPRETPLHELCALQWNSCVEASDAAFAALPRDRWIKVRYEEFTRDPDAVLAEILMFLGISPDADALAKATQRVSRQSVGKGRSLVERDGPVRAILDPMLTRHGYI